MTRRTVYATESLVLAWENTIRTYPHSEGGGGYGHKISNMLKTHFAEAQQVDQFEKCGPSSFSGVYRFIRN